MTEQHLRAPWHDYRTPGIYMLTIVAAQRGTPFGELTQQADGSIDVRLTPLGKTLKEQLLSWPQHEAGLVVMRLVVMPDHVHIVIHITQPLRRHIGTLVQGFKYGTTRAYLHELNARYGGTHRIANARPSAAERKATAPEKQQPATQQTPLPATQQTPLPATQQTPLPATQQTPLPATQQTPLPAPAEKPPQTQPQSPLGPVPGSSSASSPSPALGPVSGGSSACSHSPAPGPVPGASSASSPSPAPGPVSGGSSAGAPSPAAIVLVPPLWAEGYHDRILMGRGQLARMLHYVSDNPRRGWLKRQHRDLFYNKRTVALPLTLEQGRWLLREARALGATLELRGVLTAQRQAPDGSWQAYEWWQRGAHADGCAVRLHLNLKLMGNMFLLDEAVLLPVRLSRRTTPGEQRQHIAATLTRCHDEGAVVITPAVSPAEEAVMMAALEGGYNVIRLQAEAMSDVAAPPGTLIDYMTRGQLLFAAPWPQRPLSARPNKGTFELLNILCRLLAGIVLQG